MDGNPFEVLDLKGAWVAYLDAYGFSAGVQHRAASIISSFLRAIASFLENSPGGVRVYQFSDCIFAVQDSFPDPDLKLKELVDTVGLLQRTALEYGFAFRGVISFGPVTIAPFGCVGTTVVEAAKLEQHIAVPLVIIPKKSLIEADHFLQTECDRPAGLGVDLPTTPIKTKTGIILAHVVLPPERLYLEVAETEMEQALIRGPDHLPIAWQSALESLEVSRQGLISI